MNVDCGQPREDQRGEGSPGTSLLILCTLPNRLQLNEWKGSPQQRGIMSQGSRGFLCNGSRIDPILHYRDVVENLENAHKLFEWHW